MQCLVPIVLAIFQQAGTPPCPTQLQPPTHTAAASRPTPVAPPLSEHDARLFEAYLHELSALDSLRFADTSLDDFRKAVVKIETAEHDLNYVDAKEESSTRFRRMADITTLTVGRLGYRQTFEVYMKLMTTVSRQRQALGKAYKLLREGAEVTMSLEDECFNKDNAEPTPEPPKPAVHNVGEAFVINGIEFAVVTAGWSKEGNGYVLRFVLQVKNVSGEVLHMEVPRVVGAKGDPIPGHLLRSTTNAIWHNPLKPGVLYSATILVLQGSPIECSLVLRAVDQESIVLLPKGSIATRKKN